MAWELVAIWVIVATTIVLFMRDERRQRLARLSAQARLYATGPEWRHRDPPPRQGLVIAPALDQATIERRFVEQLQRRQLVAGR